MDMTANHQTYCSFLVRLWHETDDDAGQWRASLQNVQTRKIVHFASLTGLCDYLLQQTDAPSHEDDEARSQPRSDQVV